MEPVNTEVPPSAGWLGAAGAVPFIVLALAIPFLTGRPQIFAVDALIAYGATILSFLGGVHWGLAIVSERRRSDGSELPGWLVLSVVPSLTAWAALLLPQMIGLFLLAAAIAAMLAIDVWATQVGQAPAWYPKLRKPLTAAVVTALLFGALA